MTELFVFNGDADGICALQQLYLAEAPNDANLITGVKRDISLLEQADASGAERVTVLDISLDKNRTALNKLLANDVSIRYFDHHFAGDIPHAERLETYIDLTADRGTSYLVDRYLAGGHRAWAVVGTYGDNFDVTAARLGQELGLNEKQSAKLRELGILMNYNGYGASIEDLHLPPVELFHRVRPFTDPLAFIEDDDTFGLLKSGYREDMRATEQLTPEFSTASRALYVLPDEKWSRRVSGVFANRLAHNFPARAHAILTELGQGGYLVSIRAPLDRPDGADTLCRQFSTGGGRKAAAGINHLPEEDLQRFKVAFASVYP